MSECKLCRTPLTALNISDIEPDSCQSCVAHIIEELEPINEDPELASLSDKDLDTISKTLFPTPMWLTKKIIQWKSHVNTSPRAWYV